VARIAVEIVFETHSLSVDNERGIATGWLDGRLSKRGRRYAAELGDRRRDDGIAVVFTSDLGRAVETAKTALGGSGIPLHRDARLRECNYGELNGAAVAEIDRRRLRHVEDPFPGGESYRDVVERMREFLAELALARDGQRVLVVGHSATRWALDHLLGAADLEDVITAPFDWREGWEYVLSGLVSGAGGQGPSKT
jgi:alpha-ribazole phosphatase/probable phosphoglycerate mutase